MINECDKINTTEKEYLIKEFNFRKTLNKQSLKLEKILFEIYYSKYNTFYLNYYDITKSQFPNYIIKDLLRLYGEKNKLSKRKKLIEKYNKKFGKEIFLKNIESPIFSLEEQKLLVEIYFENKVNILLKDKKAPILNKIKKIEDEKAAKIKEEKERKRKIHSVLRKYYNIFNDKHLDIVKINNWNGFEDDEKELLIQLLNEEGDAIWKKYQIAKIKIEESPKDKEISHASAWDYDIDINDVISNEIEFSDEEIAKFKEKYTSIFNDYDILEEFLTIKYFTEDELKVGMYEFNKQRNDKGNARKNFMLKNR